MATVRPVVRYADTGQLEELRSGDSLPGGGGGGGSATQTTLTVASVSQGYAEVVLAEAGVSAASKIIAGFASGLDSENDAEELFDTDLRLAAIAEVGQIRFVFTGNAPFVGEFPITYQVFA